MLTIVKATHVSNQVEATWAYGSHREEVVHHARDLTNSLNRNLHD
jgi:hypothetical protein